MGVSYRQFSLGYFSFVCTKKSTLPIKGKTDYKKALDSRIRENDGQRIEIPGINWIPAQDRYDEERPKSFLGALISGRVFFWVLFFSLYKEKYLAGQRRNKY